MASLSQENRPIRVDTVLGPDALMLTGFSGQESVSQLFRFQLNMMSEDAGITGDKLLRTPACITVDVGNGKKRYIHGLINRFVQLGEADNISFYQAELVPWLWFLSLSRDCRIFQEKTVPDILKEVFESLGYSDFRFAGVRPPPKRTYCVQYRESHLNFISRLMEEEGLFYFFEHTDSKHTLVIADNNSAFDTVVGPSQIRVTSHPAAGELALRTVQDEHAVFIGKVTLRDYDMLNPSLNLTGESSGDGVEEIYDYPGKYTEVDVGNRYARIRLEAEEATRRVVRGNGSVSNLQAGCVFEITGHFRPETNGKYVLLQVNHSAAAGDYRGWENFALEYDTEFLAIPSNTIYRPPHVTPRPVVRGTQTAIVVGPAGEEIYVDEYNRVKVQFYWDRQGRKDEDSSCWVRVASTWAGKGWGQIQIPRIGQEVIVDFLEGDPDRPIITGRVYNAEQMPPWKLPAEKHTSGIRSRSTKNGSTSTFNEISMRDDKGKELLYIHAEKDETHIVENDRRRQVGHDEILEVSNDRTKKVGNNEVTEIEVDRTEKVGGNETIEIKGNRKEKVDGNETIEIAGNRKEKVSGAESIEIGGKRSEKVTGAEGIDLKNKRTTQVGANETLKVNANRSTKINVNDTLTVGASLKIKANAMIELKCGGSSIKITPASITLKAPMITVDAQAVAQMKGTIAKVQGNAIVQAKGVINQTKGDGMLQLKGGITMIN